MNTLLKDFTLDPTFEEVEQNELLKTVFSVIEDLQVGEKPERNREVFKTAHGLYGTPISYRKMGEKFNLSGPYVRQIYDRQLGCIVAHCKKAFGLWLNNRDSYFYKKGFITEGSQVESNKRELAFLENRIKILKDEIIKSVEA